MVFFMGGLPFWDVKLEKFDPDFGTCRIIFGEFLKGKERRPIMSRMGRGGAQKARL
jgi:hypothetical protein